MNQDNFVKLSNSLVSEKNMAASIRYVTLPEPALSDLCPAVALYTTFGSKLNRQSLVPSFQNKSPTDNAPILTQIAAYPHTS